MITAAAGRGRNAKGGSVNGRSPQRQGAWTYTDWQCIIPVPQAVDAGEGRVLITGATGQAPMIKVEKKGTAPSPSPSFSRIPTSAPTPSRPSCTTATSTRTTPSMNGATGSSR